MILVRMIPRRKNPLRIIAIRKRIWDRHKHKHKWRPAKNCTKSKKRKNNCWKNLWKKLNKCLPKKRGNLWAMRIYRKCWSTSTAFSTVKLIIRSTFCIETTLKSSSSRDPPRTNWAGTSRRRKNRPRRKKWRSLSNISSVSNAKCWRATQSHLLTGTLWTRIFSQSHTSLWIKTLIWMTVKISKKDI